MNIIFACGGTGGHIYPAVAMYEEFVRNDLGSMHKYLFVGSDYGLEKDIFPAENIAGYKLIKSRGIKRSLSPSNFKSVWCNIAAFSQARKIVRDFQPDMVIGTGGYPSFHITNRAAKQKIPFFLIEGNARPGIVVKLYHKKATRVFAATGTIRQHLKTDANLRITGLPSRGAGVCRSKSEILRDLGFAQFAQHGDGKVVVIFGGSCGSPALNAAASGYVEQPRPDRLVIWATGKANYAQVMNDITDVPINVKIVDYINNMREILSVADIIVSRAGAMTIQEIKDFKLPAVLVPFGAAAGNHQYINASELAALGTAKIIKESEITSGILRSAIDDVLSNGETIREIYDKFPASGNVSEAIYKEIAACMGGLAKDYYSQATR